MPTTEPMGFPLMGGPVANPWSIFDAFVQMVNNSISTSVTIDLSPAGNHSLTSEEFSHQVLILTQADADKDLIVPASSFRKLFINDTTKSITVKTALGAGVVISQGTVSDLWSNGTTVRAGVGTSLTTEDVQDIVGAMVTANTGMNVAYVDSAGTLTFTGSSPLTQEQVEDIAANLLTAGSNVTINYADNGAGAGTITIAASGGGGGGGGLPSGGDSGKVLKKASGADYDVVWAADNAGSGSGDEFSSYNLFRVKAINCGGSYSTGDGFLTDNSYSGGSSDSYGGTYTPVLTDPNSASANVYISMRYGTSFSYDLSGLNSSTDYVVALHFMEKHGSPIGANIMDVTLQGELVLDNFDAMVESQNRGQRAVVKRFQVTSSEDGHISLSLASSSQASISGIEVFSIS